MTQKKVSKVEEVPKVSKVNSPKNNPQTMEELLVSTGYQFKGFKRGQTVEGVVASIAAKTVLIDVGGKTEGIIAEREFETARDFIKNLKVGDKLSLQVINPESEAGQVLLSLRKTAFSTAWKQLAQILENGDEVEVLVSSVGRNGLMIQAYGLNGFIPNSQIGSHYLGKLNELVGKKIKVKPVEVDEMSEKLLFSERAVSEKEKIAEIEAALELVKIDEEYDGKISGVTPFGVFVQINLGKTPVEGLVHISEIAWEKIDDPNILLKVGDEVKVKVIGVDKEAGRLALSLKQLTTDPWVEQAKKYTPDTHIKGKVLKLTAFGAFVELEPNLTGLIHISKIPAEKKIDVGDTVSCFVEAVETDKRRISLGLVLTEKPVGYK
ncbi:MAG: S1 RNA-binding domain-containing protein [bacterium]|nr:S1 RNA-binding domain-containing protein [bacterium]